MIQKRTISAALITVFLVCLFGFQNCSGVFQSPKDFFSSEGKGLAPSRLSTGNGDTYDGKIEVGTYYRVIPDQRCGKELVIHSYLDVSANAVKLSELDPSNCSRREETVRMEQLAGSSLARGILGFAGGVFEKRATIPALSARDLSLPEVWCEAPHAGTEPRLEVLVKATSESDRAEARIFFEEEASVGARTVTSSPVLAGKRVTRTKGVKYSAQDFDLDVDVSTLNAQSTSAGRLQAVVGKKSFKVDLNCRLAGRFDPQNTTTPLTCPSGYVPVPSLAGFTLSPFCIAKYEASQNGSLPASVGGQLPWVNVSRDESIAACQALGPSYNLISNAEWQSAARNIESVPENWSGSLVASVGGLSRGHSDNDPDYVLPSSLDDNDGCSGTKQTCSSTTWSSQRRTLRLTNGSLVWDLAGNADEWIKDDVQETFGPFAPVSQVRTAAFDQRAASLFGPALDYTSFTTAPFAGLGDLHVDFAGGALRRGGGWEWNGTDYGGLFKAYLYDNPSTRTASATFRCVYHP